MVDVDLPRMVSLSPEPDSPFPAKLQTARVEQQIYKTSGLSADVSP